MEEYLTPLENENYQEYINRIQSSRPNVKIKEVYMERHHILPKCCGGLDDDSNLIYLYAQEHYYAHKLLALENPQIAGLQYAWWNMCQCDNHGKRIYDISADDYAEARKRFSSYMSELISTQIQSGERSILGENNPNYGNKWSEEQIQAASRRFTGKYIGDKNPRARSVICLETLEIFSTVKEAAQKYNLSKSWVSKCCLRTAHTAGGYHWCYLEEYTEEVREELLRIPKGITYPKVQCIETGEVFTNAKSAGLAKGITPGQITACCRHKKFYRTAGGYHWEYYKEEGED